FLEPDALPPGERVGRVDDHDELLPADHLERPLPATDRSRADREVGHALLDRILEQGAVAELVQPDRDVRMALMPDADVARQHADRHREDGRDLELAELEGQRRTGALAAALERSHRDARL